jgi:hypothetical protein
MLRTARLFSAHQNAVIGSEFLVFKLGGLCCDKVGRAEGGRDADLVSDQFGGGQRVGTASRALAYFGALFRVGVALSRFVAVTRVA